MTEQYRIEARSLEWVEIMTRLIIGRTKALGATTPQATITTVPEGVLYLIDKDFMPAEQLAAALGHNAAAVAGAKEITLKPHKVLADWQKPTVDDIGHA